MQQQLQCVRRVVHTHDASHAHVFWHSFFAWRTDIAYTHGSLEFAVRMAHISISLSLFSCFIRHPCCSSSVTSTPRSRPHRLRRTVLDPKARVKRTSARAPRSLATWPIPRTPQAGQCPEQSNTQKTCSQVLKRRQPVSKGVAGNCNGAPPRAPCMTVLQEPRRTACRTVSKATCFRVQWFVGNCNDRLKFNYRRPGWTTITCKSQNFGYVEKIFTHLRRKLNRTEDDENVWPEDQRFDLGTIYVDNDEISNSSWHGIWSKFDRMPETRTSKGSRHCLISLWGWLRRIYLKFWIYLLWSVISHRGWRWPPCPWSSNQVGDSKGTLCLGRVSHSSEANIMWKEQIRHFQQSRLELMENQLSSSGIFPRIHIDSDRSECSTK